MRLIIWFIFGCASVVVYGSKHGITVFSPSMIRPNRMFSVAISNAGTRNVKFQVTLTGLDMNDSKNITVNYRSSILAPFKVKNVREDGEYRLEVASTNSAVLFKEEINLDVATKTMSILIHTDKPVYKPGDTLQFRVLLFDIDLMPVTRIRTIDVVLTDQDGNSVRKWGKAELRNGVFEARILLASSPVLGKWTLTVTANDGSIDQAETKTIKVEKYTLPPFFVKVFPSRTITARNKTILLTVESHYTFGYPVTGTAVVQLYLTESRFRPQFSTTVNFKGKAPIEFNLAEGQQIDVRSSDDNDIEDKVKNIMVHLSVTETFTNITVSKKQTISVYKNPFKVSLRKSSQRFIAGRSYDADIIVHDHNGKPYRELGTPLRLKVEYDGKENDQNYVIDGLDDNGIKRVTFHPPNGTNQITVTALFDSDDESILAHINAQHQGIQIISSKNNRFLVNETVTFTVKCSEKINLLSYFIKAKGNIISAYTVNVLNTNSYKLQNIKLTPKMVPLATLFIYYINLEGILVYDTYEMAFEEFNNNFKLVLDEDEYRPRTDMYVEATAAGDSDVFLYAIDQSAVLREPEGYNFYQKDVLDQYTKMVGITPNSYDNLQNLGLFLRTTSETQTGTGMDKLIRSGRSAIIQRARLAEPRYHFQEVWLWESFSMDRKPRLETSFSLPDSITSWHVSGYALSPTKGLGIVKQPQTIRVSKDFHVMVTLPYSIKRNEITVIQVKVFNFLGNDITSDVLLYSKKNEIEFVDDSSVNDTLRKKAIFVPSHSVKATSFLIRAKTLGEIAIHITAQNPLQSDDVEHILRVVPESFLEESLHSRFIACNEHNTTDFSIPIDIPRRIENSSVQIEFKLDPDIVGIASSNLNELTRIPRQSGEQNMLNFVPHVAILDLLHSSSIEASEELKTSITNHVSTGYQDQLKYKHYDGGFRDFPAESSEPSIFLTAQVAMSLKAAAKYIDIDRTVVDQAFKWLASLQKSDGSFEEVGDVYNQAMQGQRNSKRISLTAFVLIAFLESEDIKTKHQSVVNKASKHLADNFNSIGNMYDLAVATCALSMLNHAMKEDFLDKLVESSELDHSNHGRYWNAGDLSIEVTAYGLLSYLEQKRYPDAIVVSRWLNLKREALGAFANIQDTFIGLKALAKVSEHMSSKKNEYDIIISYEVTGKTVKTQRKFIVDKHQLKAFNLQLPNTIRSVDIRFVGKGYGFFQVHYQYAMNVLSVKKEKNRFKIDAKVNNATSTIHLYNLEVCVAYKAPEKFAQADKTMVEVFFPSGLAAAKDDVQDLSNSIKHIESRFGDTSLVIYYQSVGETNQCFHVTAKRRFKVASHRPAYVMVYSVNNRKEFGIQEYAGPQMEVCDICEEDHCKRMQCKS